MKKLYCIGNTHFDPVWEWTWDEAMASIRATFRSALSRMEEDPDFIYSFATPPVFEWIKETDPALFEAIKERVREGRWELGEGWWLQPDCYSASGESYVRQGLYGQRWLYENFGKYADTVFNIDSFGHSPQLPQILKKSGIDNYVYVRPEAHHIPLDKPLYYWEAPDGSRVLTYRADRCYDKDMSSRLKHSEGDGDDEMIVYGVTDHGGAPTVAALKAINEHPDAFCSFLTRYFDDHRDCETVLRREFITGDFGVYANLPQIKSGVKRGEYSLLNAEKAAAIEKLYFGADSARSARMQEKLTDAWKDVLFNEFHDIIGGACIKDAYEDVFAGLGRAYTNSEEVLHYTLQRMTSEIPMLGHPWNLVVWNLNGTPYAGMIEAEVQWVPEFDWYDRGIALEDAEGNRYPCQVIRGKCIVTAFRSRFVFDAEIPAMGYKVFRVVQTNEALPPKPTMSDRIETDDLIVTFRDGCIACVTDKQGKVLAQNLFVPASLRDIGDTWAFNIRQYDPDAQPWEHMITECKESGCIRSVVRSVFQSGHSTLTLYYTIPAKGTEITVRWNCIWNDRYKAVKLLFDVPTAEHEAAIPYGVIGRGETAADVPLGKFVKTEPYTLFSRDSFAYNLHDGKLGVTLFRSPIYGDMRILPIDMEDDHDIIGQGSNDGVFRICFDRMTPAAAYPASDAFENPPVVICEAHHGGTRTYAHSYLSLEAEHCTLTTVKAAESGDGTVFRLAEYDGIGETVVLHIGEEAFALDMKPHEIKTVLYENGTIREINMIETERK